MTHSHAASADEIATQSPEAPTTALPETEPFAASPVDATPAAPEAASPVEPAPEPVAAEPAMAAPSAPEPDPEPATVSAVSAEPETVPAPDSTAETLEAAAAAPTTEEIVADESTSEESAPEEQASDEQASADDDEDEPEPPRTMFADLGLSEPIQKAIVEMGYLYPTPIQEQAIPFVLMGRDVLGCAQTGTGKTASFVLPMMDILAGSRARARMPRSLILEPTRELALQVAENFLKYGKFLKLNHALLIGGESLNDQKDALMRGVDVLIATPGRLIDLFERGGLLLTDAKLLVIDEADRMLDMGFIPDVERIVAMLPRSRQTLFFSATMAPEIRRLADAFLQNPKEVTVSPPASVSSTITEGVALVAEHDKREALRRWIRAEQVQNALVFCNRKRDVDILFKSLSRHEFSVGALHGDMTQSVRFATLEKFKNNELQLLCCSDVAARGLDIGGLSHVFNFDVPHHAEDYVHRIGRTGRAGKEGRAFTLASPEDRLAVEAIEKLTGHAIPRVVIEGLDVVEWAEGSGRSRGRGKGRGVAAKGAPKSEAKSDTKRESSRDKPRKEAAPARERAPRDGAAPKGRAPREGRARSPLAEPIAVDRAPEWVQSERMQQPERAPTERTPVERSAAERAPAPRAPVERAPVERAPIERAPAERAPVERAPAERVMADRAPAGRMAEQRPPIRGERERDRSRFRGRDDDLGPRVMGFGDDIPAFMLLPTRAMRPGRGGHEVDTSSYDTGTSSVESDAGAE